MNKDIIFLNPVCTHNIWGGTRLNREFGYSIEGDDIGRQTRRPILLGRADFPARAGVADRISEVRKDPQEV